MPAPNGQTGDEHVLVSACLLGLRTRYDGAHRRREDVVRMLGSCRLVPVCPEQLGGLATPRPPAELDSGDGGAVLDGCARVIAAGGADVTGPYLQGAELTAQMAELLGARRAILKEGSPACGVRRIRRHGEDVEGCGVTAALLRRRGVQVEGRE